MTDHYISKSYLYRAIGVPIDGACGNCRYSRSDCMCHSLSRMDICGIVEDAPAADMRLVVQREAVMQALNKYFSIGDSDTYELTRVKEAFYVGTMTLDDFEEWNEDNVSDLCDYLMKEIYCPNYGADMRMRGEDK